MLPPMWLYMRIGKDGSKGVGLWLPIFLVWLLLLPIVVVALVVTILVDVALAVAEARYHKYTLLLLGCLALLSETRGLAIRVDADDTKLEFRFM